MDVDLDAVVRCIVDTRENRSYVVCVSRVMVAGRLFSKGDVITSKSLGTLSGIVRSGALTALPVGLEADSSAGIPLDFDEPAPGATSYSLKRGPE